MLEIDRFAEFIQGAVVAIGKVEVFLDGMDRGGVKLFDGRGHCAKMEDGGIIRAGSVGADVRKGGELLDDLANGQIVVPKFQLPQVALLPRVSM